LKKLFMQNTPPKVESRNVRPGLERATSLVPTSARDLYSFGEKRRTRTTDNLKYATTPQGQKKRPFVLMTTVDGRWFLFDLKTGEKVSVVDTGKRQVTINQEQMPKGIRFTADPSNGNLYTHRDGQDWEYFGNIESFTSRSRKRGFDDLIFTPEKKTKLHFVDWATGKVIRTKPRDEFQLYHKGNCLCIIGEHLLSYCDESHYDKCTVFDFDQDTGFLHPMRGKSRLSTHVYWDKDKRTWSLRKEEPPPSFPPVSPEDPRGDDHRSRNHLRHSAERDVVSGVFDERKNGYLELQSGVELRTAADIPVDEDRATFILIEEKVVITAMDKHGWEKMRIEWTTVRPERPQYAQIPEVADSVNDRDLLTCTTECTIVINKHGKVALMNGDGQMFWDKELHSMVTRAYSVTPSTQADALVFEIARELFVEDQPSLNYDGGNENQLIWLLDAPNDGLLVMSYNMKTPLRVPSPVRDSLHFSESSAAEGGKALSEHEPGSCDEEERALSQGWQPPLSLPLPPEEKYQDGVHGPGGGELKIHEGSEFPVMPAPPPPHRDVFKYGFGLVLFMIISYLLRTLANSSLVPPPQPSASAKKRTRRKRAKALREANVRRITYRREDVLGQGCHGTVVYEGSYEGRPVAVKRLVRDAQAKSVGKEISSLIKLDAQENVVRYYAKESEEPGFILLALELCKYSVYDVIVRDPDFNLNINHVRSRLDGKVSPLIPPNPKKIVYKRIPKDWWFLMRDMICGLAFVHEKKMVHRDIKPQNILITERKGDNPRLIAKIADLGMSRQLAAERTSLSTQTHGGTWGWQAPEILENNPKRPTFTPDNSENSSRFTPPLDSKDGLREVSSSVGGKSSQGKTKITQKVDVFALGCVFFFILTGGGHPFGVNSFTRCERILKGNYDLSSIGMYPLAQDLIEQMIHCNPGKRISTSDALLHPFFWDDQKKLKFLHAFSDTVLEKLDPSEHTMRVKISMEKFGRTIIPNGWDKMLDAGLMEDVASVRKYDYNSPKDLVRVFRNKWSHFPHHLENLFQSGEQRLPSYLDYWLKRFPRLLLFCYKLARDNCDPDTQFYKLYFGAVSHPREIPPERRLRYRGWIPPP